ncbi:hypothetical protein ISF_01074 [Cordyceps fumosorosea ARSEF 2679]|uniref:Uncharacterized protein n=1 Tax=Cordyceps fumosorosea (strain ARSEF 2679) TaxID=1081104 RepID=A0A168ESV7_CORFA|nr:hypothetical protein ISF_01074 [Cordyceps fumosorosea ARSEF 2679]OAA74173.1 hypothetical protein ISF_01074 [Cordyceps fumosorosea ARSEF 2679]
MSEDSDSDNDSNPVEVEIKAPFPMDLDAWKQYMSQQDHKNYSLTNINPKSASESTVEQFYTLKVLWMRLYSRNRLRRDLRIDEDSLSKAEAFLEDSSSWGGYKAACGNETLMSDGLFGLVQLYHRRCADGQADIPYRQHLKFPWERRPAGGEEGAGGPPSLPTESSSISTLSEVTVDATAARWQVEDEEIVNVAFVLFLNALVRATPEEDVTGDWWPCRSSFCIPNSASKAHKAYKALVDGMFRVDGASPEQIMEQARFREEFQRLRARAGLPAEATAKERAAGSAKSQRNAAPRGGYKHKAAIPNTKTITAIIEVKPMARAHYHHSWREQILVQEAAQMAAWIGVIPALLGQKPDKNGKFRRLLFSQDQREVFVTIATYTKEYIHYIMNSIDKPAYQEALLGPECFLHMQPYGPFRVDNVEHMAMLAPLLVALSYQNFVI